MKITKANSSRVPDPISHDIHIGTQGIRSLSRRLLPGLFWATVLFLGCFLLMYRLGKFPALWWDEGWTLSAARNWVEHGHLGHYLAGKAVLPRSPVRFPVVVPVALSMKILGVGTWQGRLPGVIFTVLALSLVLYLTCLLYTSPSPRD